MNQTSSESIDSITSKAELRERLLGYVGTSRHYDDEIVLSSDAENAIAELKRERAERDR